MTIKKGSVSWIKNQPQKLANAVREFIYTFAVMASTINIDNFRY